MNRRNITLILVGFLLVMFQFNIHIGKISIDICHDTVGYLLAFWGIMSLSGRNKLFTKAKAFIIGGLFVSVLVQFFNCFDFTEYQNYYDTLRLGVTLFCFIYATYYFTEGMITLAKDINYAAVTQSYQLVWTVFAGGNFAYFIALMSGIDTVAMIVMILSYVAGLYYTMTVFNTSKELDDK